MPDSAIIDSLLIKLNTIDLQQKDPKLYQFLKDLATSTQTINRSIAVISGGSGGGTVINNTYQTIQQMLLGSDGEDGMIGPPGLAGATGTAGARGADGLPGLVLENYNEETNFLVAPSGPAPLDYVVMSDGANPPNPMDDGLGNFIYITYTP